MSLNVDSQRYRDAVTAYAFTVAKTELGVDPGRPLKSILTDGRHLPSQALIYARNRITTLPNEGLLGSLEATGWITAGRFARWVVSVTSAGEAPDK